MPVVVELLLLDEDPSAGDGAHLANGKGVYADLARQLQDANSHLRRKSAFGALVARGASVHYVDEEQVTLPKTPVGVNGAIGLLAAGTPATVSDGPESSAEAAPGTAWDATREPSACSSDSAAATGKCRAVQPQEEASSSIVAPVHQVPPIPHFPIAPSKPLASVDAWWRSVILYDWWPSCTPEPCKALPGVPADPCKISVLDSNSDHLCLPATSAQLDMASHEAGLGGFPLSLPNAYAAFPKSASSTAFAPASATSTSTSSSLQAAATAYFRKAGVEVDEDELTVIFAPQRSQKGGVGSSRERTPSTASTTAPMSPQAAPLPPWVTYSRLIFPLSDVRGVRHWPKADVAKCWSSDVRGADALSSFQGRSMQGPPGAEYGPPWPNVVEVSAVPRGAADEIVILLALPTTQLAKRLQDAAIRRPRKADPAARDQSTVGAVRCELHIAASLEVGPGPSTNFAAVVRRGVCEACHVGAERVRICSIRDASRDGGAAWVPSSEASPAMDVTHGEPEEKRQVSPKNHPQLAEAQRTEPAEGNREEDRNLHVLPTVLQDAAVQLPAEDLQRRAPTSPHRIAPEVEQVERADAGKLPQISESSENAIPGDCAPQDQASCSDEMARQAAPDSVCTPETVTEGTSNTDVG